MANVLVTGGAGFIGSHLVDGLLAAGHRVRVVDALVGQVHGETQRPEHLAAEAELIHADVSDTDRWAHHLDETDVLYHLAAEVGVGQSMYEIRRYTRGNTMATADLLETLINRRGNVRKVIVASSMSIYGEGPYECAAHGRVFPSAPPRRSASRTRLGASLPRLRSSGHAAAHRRVQATGAHIHLRDKQARPGRDVPFGRLRLRDSDGGAAVL